MKKGLVVYVAALHLALAALVVNDSVAQRLAVRAGLIQSPDPEFIQQMRNVHARLDPAVPAGAVVFLGDSNTQSMPVEEITPHAVNFGIGWQRSDQLLGSMRGYASLQRAAAVVVMIGTDDVIEHRAPRYGDVLAAVPAGVHVVLVSAPPLQAIDMQPSADAARRACAADQRCTFVDAFAALDGKSVALLADGTHLSPAGYAVLIALLQDALRSRTSPAAHLLPSSGPKSPSSLR